VKRVRGEIGPVAPLGRQAAQPPGYIARTDRRRREDALALGCLGDDGGGGRRRRASLSVEADLGDGVILDDDRHPHEIAARRPTRGAGEGAVRSRSAT
jgi:hypothetical protein